MKILVPVDGSTHSMEALKVAADCAKLKTAQIYVISVVPFVGGLEDHEISPARMERTMGRMEQIAGEAVKKACDCLAADNLLSQCSSQTIMASVSVPDAIIDFAETENIDLIVIGSRGLSSSSRFKLGSVASQIAKYSPCSVYLVKSSAL